MLAADGNDVAPGTQIGCPLPSFDPQWLEHLDPPGGAVRLESPFYIKRRVDDKVHNAVLKSGVTIRIKGCRQMGKSSLLAHLSQHLRDIRYPWIYIDFQRLEESHFEDLSTLLFCLADWIARKFRTNVSPDVYWQRSRGPKDKIIDFLETEVLQQAETPVVLMFDEVDRVFNRNYRADFFSLIRFWHNNRSFDPVWEKLNLVLAYSTEAFMFIQDINQSPFNVGDDYELLDFDRLQLVALNQRHNNPIGVTEMEKFVDLFGGHPYLVRKALYDLVAGQHTVDELIKSACNDDGLFSDHLHRYLWRFHESPGLCDAMKSVIGTHSCPTDEFFYVLRSAGLVRGTDRHNVLPRCGLYDQYFGRHL